MSPVRWTIIKDEAELPTLLLVGAGLQSLLVLLLPLYIAVLPTCLLLLYRAASIYLITRGIIRNPRLENVTAGKLWAVPPSQDGIPCGKSPANAIVLFIVGARSNQSEVMGRS